MLIFHIAAPTQTHCTYLSNNFLKNKWLSNIFRNEEILKSIHFIHPPASDKIEFEAIS